MVRYARAATKEDEKGDQELHGMYVWGFVPSSYMLTFMGVKVGVAKSAALPILAFLESVTNVTFVDQPALNRNIALRPVFRVIMASRHTVSESESPIWKMLSRGWSRDWTTLILALRLPDSHPGKRHAKVSFCSL